MSTIIEKTVKLGNKPLKVMCEQYMNADEVVRDCEKRKITDCGFSDVRNNTEKQFRWSGVESYEDAMNLMRYGYQPTVEKMKDVLKISRQGSGKRIAFVNNIVGANPIVPLAMMGVPNCMIDMQMKPIKCKVIDVYYDMTMSSGASSETIIENGQKLLGTILELERQGYRFNLYGVQTYTDSESCDVLAVRVKSANQPIDLKRISFALTHTAFFRIVGFDWYSKTPKGKYRSGYGYAFGYDYNETQCKAFAKNVFGNNAVYISAAKLDENHLKEVLTNDKSKD